MNTLPLDAQGRPIQDATYGQTVEKVMTFDGGTTNDPGDFNGTGNPATLFTVEGVVKMKIIGLCSTSLTGASATVEIGVTGATAALIAQTTGTDIDAGEIWHDASPDKKIELTSVMGENIVTSDVIQTVATADVTAGVIKYFCMWYPLSSDANVS